MGCGLMIYGIGTDITKVSRFEKWVKNEEFIKRFFNPQEIMENGSLNAKCEHYAARFAAKEAFSKALGTGITGFNLKEYYRYIEKVITGEKGIFVEGKHIYF